MVQRYVRFPLKVETIKLYKDIQYQMERDVENDYGNKFKVKIPLTRVFDLIASPKVNENYIQIDKRILYKIAIKRRKK